MQTTKLLLAAVLAVLCRAAGADAAVEVTFVHPERYTDATSSGAYGGKSREPVLREIGAYLERLGERGLGPGRRLTVEVLDVRLAGQYEPWHLDAYDLRVLRGVSWPLIKLRYRLEDNGVTVLSAEETVADRDYLLLNPTARHSSEVLPYEKAMLSRWFQARFVQHRPPPR